MPYKCNPFLARLALITLLLVLIFHHTLQKSTTGSTIRTLKQYIMLTVNTANNQPQHLLLFHDDHTALYKTMHTTSLKVHPERTNSNRTSKTTSESNWKLCTYQWQPNTSTLHYGVVDSDSDLSSYTSKHQNHITFRTIEARSTSNTPNAFVAYPSDHQTTYLWKPTKNTFRCKSLHGKTIYFQFPSDAKQSTPSPFDAIRVSTTKKAQVRISSRGHANWIDCGLTCRKTNGGNAVRKYKAVLYLKPTPNKSKSRAVRSSPTFQNAIVRWGSASVMVQWMDINGVRRVVEKKLSQPLQ